MGSVDERHCTLNNLDISFPPPPAAAQPGCLGPAGVLNQLMAEYVKHGRVNTPPVQRGNLLPSRDYPGSKAGGDSHGNRGDYHGNKGVISGHRDRVST